MTDLLKLGLTAGDSIEGSIPEAVWPGRGDKGLLYPGTLGFIAGPSGASKSLATHKIMADWTNTRGHVILCDGEDGGGQGGMARKRAEAAGADLGKLLFGEFVIPRDNERLQSAIEEIGGEVLVVWDTADTWIDAPLQRWGKALHPLSHDVFPRTQAIGLLVHHTLKHVRKGTDWRAAVGGGTSGLIGKSRFGLLYGVRPDDTNQRLLVRVKNSYGDVRENGLYNQSVAFEFDETDLDDGKGNSRPVTFLRMTEKGVGIPDPTAMVYLGGEGGGARGPSPEKAAEAAEWLVKLLGAGAMPTSDAAVCQTNPDGNPAGGACGYMDASKAQGGCPYCGGKVSLVQGIRESAEQDGLSFSGAVRKALGALACVTDRKGGHKAPGGLVFYWSLPDGHPRIANPTTYRKDLP
jgi:hypothetical protein